MIELDTTAFMRAAQGLMEHTKRTGFSVLQQQARLLVRDAAKFTPPTGTQPINESWNDQKKVQEAAIVRDLFGGRKTMATEEYSTQGIFERLPSSLLREMHKTTGGSSLIKVFARKDGTVYGTESRLYKPRASIQEMHAHHRRYRLRSSGRVSSAGASTRNIGRWKFINKMVVSEAAMRMYLKYLFGNVGFVKSGWREAAANLGVALPNWVTRHRGKGFFLIESGSNNISITVANAVGIAQKHNYRMQIMRRALDRRTESMTHQLNAMLGKTFDGYSAK